MYKILVADDEALELEALSYFIRNSGLEIETIIECASGEDAMKQILLNKPEIILLDINMPGMNGLEVLERIQKMDYPSRVIFSTAYNYFEYAVQALRLGAMDFMVKPVKKEQIIGVITHAIDELDELAEKAYDSALMKQTLELMGSKILKDLVVGEIREEDLYYLELMGIGYETRGNVFCIYFLEEIPGEEQKKLGKLLKQELVYLDMQAIYSWNNFMMTAVIFMSGREQEDLGAMMMNKVITSLVKNSGHKFFLAVGDLFEDLSQIEKSFDKARERVGDVIERPGENPQAKDVPGDVERICRFIDEHYSERLSLEEIADMAGYSKYYINRLFKEYKGTTVIDYLIRIRIREAKKLLKSGNYSVKQISLMVGYSEPNYFTLTFKKLEGISPLKYRYNQE